MMLNFNNHYIIVDHILEVYLDTCQRSKMKLLTKKVPSAVEYFCKKLHLRSLTGLWILLCIWLHLDHIWSSSFQCFSLVNVTSEYRSTTQSSYPIHCNIIAPSHENSCCHDTEAKNHEYHKNLASRNLIPLEET